MCVFFNKLRPNLRDSKDYQLKSLENFNVNQLKEI